jgi:drug/metabolite transporter (DMT)-like permease
MSERTPASDTEHTAKASSDRATRLAGIGLMCMALMCFACLDAIAKTLNPLIGPVPTTFARYLSSVILVTVVINPWTQPGVLVTKKPWMQWARSLLLFGSTMLNFLALQYLQLTETMSIMFVSPLLVALLSGPLLGEWVGARRMAAIAVGFCGILIVTRPGFGGMHWAALFSAAGTVCYALFAILTRILSRHDSSATTMVYSGLGGLAIMTPVVPFFWKTPETISVWLLMMLIGGFGALGHWLLILAHKRAPAPVLSPFIYSQMVWMILLGWLFFGDWPDQWTLVGAGVVIASGLYLLHRERVTGRVVTNPGTTKSGV